MTNYVSMSVNTSEKLPMVILPSSSSPPKDNIVDTFPVNDLHNVNIFDSYTIRNYRRKQFLKTDI